jgi:hypothetical protein
MARQKTEQQEFMVQVNLAYIITAKDELDAHNKVVNQLAVVRPPGTLTRRIKWSEAKSNNGQSAKKDQGE